MCTQATNLCVGVCLYGHEQEKYLNSRLYELGCLCLYAFTRVCKSVSACVLTLPRLGHQEIRWERTGARTGNDGLRAFLYCLAATVLNLCPGPVMGADGREITVKAPQCLSVLLSAIETDRFSPLLRSATQHRRVTKDSQHTHTHTDMDRSDISSERRCII